MNFVKCDIQNKQRKFIFISTDKEDALSENETRLENEIPCKRLLINKIPNETFFINMLPTAFDISNLSKTDISLLNLNKANAINFSNGKISFNLSVMEKYILASNDVNLKISEFTPVEHCILLVVICIGFPLFADFLLILAQSLYKEFFKFSISKTKFEDALENMYPKPLKVSFYNMNNKIYTDHDLTFGAALLYFKENNMYKISCDTIYRILSNQLKKREL